MSVEVKGMDEVLSQLEKRFSSKELVQIEDEALNKGSEVLLKALKSNFESFKATGNTIKEMSVTKPYSKNISVLRAKSIKWKGPTGRYRIIHLNEHGYTRNGKKYTPRGFGVIAKTLKEVESEYRNIVIKELKKKL
ncbi:HD superfamily phosphohydrolase [Staphylococcus hominis]|jgi:hypothetical protein|uniref:hypothetical protein n=1 Tax=Staphylococcus hominis TaxID=1290 RepID=UPI00119DE72C|nr:hypothetical protein [Staphylococcus hominis]